jgi:DNA-directed RNA polymerase subunit F
MGNLAVTYRDQGKWKEAESLQVQVMEASKEKFGPLHPSTLIAMGNLALTYRDQIKSKEARELLDASIEGMQQVLGADHPTTIKYMHALVNISQHAQNKASRNTMKDAGNKLVAKIASIIPKIKAKRG